MALRGVAAGSCAVMWIASSSFVGYCYEYGHSSSRAHRDYDLSWGEFGRLVSRLVEQIAGEYALDAVVGVAKGGCLVPAVVVSSALRRDLYVVKVSSRRNEEILFDEPRVVQRSPGDVQGKSVLIVDDISVSGRTLSLVRDLLLEKGARQTRTATLAVHDDSFLPDWFALRTSDVILTPWDRDVYAGGRWELNPEYAGEIAGLGLT